MNYETSYHKYWPNKELWDIAFNDALPNNDRRRLIWAVEQQWNELPDLTGPVTVDVDAKFCMPTFMSDVLNKTLDVADDESSPGEVSSPEKNAAELEFLRDLAVMRNTPVKELSHLPDAYVKPAYWLKNVRVEHAADDQLISLNAVRDLYTRGIREQQKPFTESHTLENGTLRTWSEYVHNDHPLVQWMAVSSDLLARKFKTRCESNLLDSCNNANHRFASGGVISIHGLYGEALRRLGTVSFAGKWKRLRPRPEQVAYYEGTPLPQVFPEGSPGHPAKNAMHHRAAQVLAYITAIIFDSCEELMGRPLYEELQLEADNISYARCSAGVHYPSDNYFKQASRVMAEEICSEAYGYPCRVPEKMMAVDFSV